MNARFLAPVAVLLLASACSSSKPETAAAAPGAGAQSAAVVDASTDVRTDVEAGGDADAAADAPPPYDAAACQAALAPGFQAVSVPPLINKVCSSTQIGSFVQACLGTDLSTCASWTQDPANDTCFHHCIVSPYSSTPAVPGMTPPPPMAAWGPIIDTQNPGDATWFNVGGCIALADPTQASCGQDLGQRFQCEYAACTANCPIPTQGSQEQWTYDYQSCVQSADYGPCQTYAAKVSTSCTLSSPDAGPAAFCYEVASGNTAALTQLITQQCGM
jgi:hypothetical protein